MTGAGGSGRRAERGLGALGVPSTPREGSPQPTSSGCPQGGSAAGTGREQPGCETRRDEVWDEVWDAGTLATMNSASSGLSSCSFWAISAREMRE